MCLVLAKGGGRIVDALDSSHSPSNKALELTGGRRRRPTAGQRHSVKEEFSWYEEKRIGLGYDFLLQIDAGIRFIERDPEIYQIGYKGTRKHIIKRFPYKMIYLLEKHKIIILAIIHSKRNPNLIIRRIDDSDKS